MITAFELAKYAGENKWIVIDKGKDGIDGYIQFLTPAGKKVLVRFYEDGSVKEII